MIVNRGGRKAIAWTILTFGLRELDILVIILLPQMNVKSLQISLAAADAGYATRVTAFVRARDLRTLV